MSRIDYIQGNFNVGEISPLFKGQVSADKYKAGLDILENMFTTPHGPVIKRGGTQFIGEVKYSDKQTRLYSFSVNRSINYVLEFGDKYIRFFTERGQLICDTASAWVTATGYIIGDFIEATDGLIYYCIQNHTSGVGNDEPGVGANWSDYWVQQTEYEIPTTYTEDEVFDLNFTQSNDVLFIAHKDHAPAKLERIDVYDWRLSNISFTNIPSSWGANDYPQVVTIMEERLIWANTPSKPQTLWGSVSADYTNQTTGTGDSDAFTYTVGSDKLNVIEWMSPGEILAVGTSGAEFKMTSTSLGEPITPTNISIKRQSNLGSASIPAIQIGNNTLFVQKGGKKVRNFRFKFETNAYDSEDLTILSEHITGGFGVKIEGADYCNEPNSIWWGYRTDGQLVGMAYEPEIKAVGWFRYLIGGTDAKVKSLASVDNNINAAFDDVYLIVERTINGSVVKYVEVIRSSLQPNEDLEDSFYVDSGLSYDKAVPTDVFTGAEHLEGESVRVLADGSVHPNVTISGGGFTLNREASVVHMGVGYDAKLKTLRIEGGNPIGTSQGKIQRIHRVQIRLYQSLGLKIGDGVQAPDIIPFGPGAMDLPLDLVTGDIGTEFSGDFTTEAIVELLHDQPLPLTILAIMAEVRTK